MRLALHFKPSILQDHRLTRCPHGIRDAFDGRPVIFREDHGNPLAYFHDGFTSAIPPGLFDHVRHAEVEDTFACQATRRQGVYRMEGAAGDAKAALERVPWSDLGKYRAASAEERARAKQGEADYHVIIRASNLKIAEELYLAIRRGTVLPVDDWDAPQIAPA